MPAHATLTLILTLLLGSSLAGCTGSFDVDFGGADEQPPAGISELTILSHGQRMAGHIYTAKGPGPHPTVVLLHGLPGNERNLDLAQVLRRDGWNVLFFHYRGAWGSDGSYSFSHLIEDSASVLDYLQAHAAELRVDSNRLALVGHSAGGFTAILGARDPRVACVVAMAPADFASYPAGGQIDRIAGYIDSLFMLKGTSGAAIRAEVMAHQQDWLLAPALASLGKPALVVTAELDTVITPEVPKVAGVRGVEFANADHSFNSHRLELAELVQDFLRNDCPGL